MAIINLRDYYPFYTSDCFMEVSEEVAEMFKEFERKEAAYRLRTYRHKAYYCSQNPAPRRVTIYLLLRR